MERELNHRGPREDDRNRSWGFGSDGGRGDERRGNYGEFGQRQAERGRDRGQESSTGGWGFGTGPGSVYRPDPDRHEPTRTRGPGGGHGEQWDVRINDEGRSGWWYRGESFAGRGPQGYRRSDGRIQEDICDCLTDDPRIDARDVSVRVENGEVTLEGKVNSRQEKRDAENLCERITGVRDVHNHLRVASPQSAGRSEGGSLRENDDLGTGPQGTTAGSRT